MSANELYLAVTERESDLFVGAANLPLRILQADYDVLNISTPIHGDLPLWDTTERRPWHRRTTEPMWEAMDCAQRCATCDGGGCPDCTDTDW